MQRKILIAAAVLTPLGLGPAVAGNGFARIGPGRDVQCFVSISDWQPLAAVELLAAGNGWTLKFIKIDDGCYEVRGWDSTGIEFEAKLDPETLTIVQLEIEGSGDINKLTNLKPTQMDDSK